MGFSKSRSRTRIPFFRSLSGSILPKADPAEEEDDSEQSALGSLASSLTSLAHLARRRRGVERRHAAGTGGKERRCSSRFGVSRRVAGRLSAGLAFSVLPKCCSGLRPLGI